MKPLVMASLGTAITIALASMGVNAQQDPEEEPSTPPGLYVTVSQSEVYIVQGDKQLDVKVGETAFASEDTLKQIDEIPKFLNWPCGSQEADMVPGYSLESLPPGNRMEEVVRRFFEGPEILAPSPAWLNGESHGSFSADEISRFSTSAYWYTSGDTTPKMEALRPEVLLISLYPVTQQVVVDQNHFQELQDMYGPEDIPVTFVFNEENVVPVSFFGENVTMQQVADAYFEKGITIADVPIWYAGDRQLVATPAQLEQMFDIPAVQDIDPERFAALVADLQTNGFTKKPITVILMAQNDSMVIDEGEKVRAAQSIGIDSIPLVFFSYSEDSHKKRCGLPIPRVAASEGGIGEGGILLPEVDIPPIEPILPPEEPASGN